MVPWKAPYDLRSGGNYRAVNYRTIPDRYSMPRIQDFTANLSGGYHLP